MPKTRATIKRERKITAVYCRRMDTLLYRYCFFNDELWNKTKEEWNLEQWKEYFQLKEQTKNL
jgi:hypothetical protein